MHSRPTEPLWSLARTAMGDLFTGYGMMSGDATAGDSSSNDFSNIEADPAAVAGMDATVSAPLSPPVLRREIVAVGLWTLAADLLIFRTVGFSGPGLFFALAPVLFLIGCPQLARGPARRVTISLLLLVAIRLIWLGSGWTVFSGVVLVIALSMSAAGYVPYVLEGCLMASRAVVDGAKRMIRYPTLPIGRGANSRSGGRLLAWFLPAVAALVFGAIFVFANPDLFDLVSIRITRYAERFQLWLEGISIWEFPFCLLALLIGVGLMRPALPMTRIGPAEDKAVPTTEGVRSPLYGAYRNTLWTLIVLFAVYLTFEFITLWKRDFPDGFYYAGYAHQGAAWLTFALALATAVLSLVLSGPMLGDDRLYRLRTLAWIWSAQNILLAAAVYNRLMIYVGYNGMTQLRSVGFFGITVVVIGFCLVLYKINRNHGFWWLIRAQLISLVLTVITYSVFPVDYVVHRYNAATVASGYLHPSVMIAVKPISNEGYFPLLKLTQCDDPIIRDGVLALLADRQQKIESGAAAHWTEYQGSQLLLKRQMKKHESQWTKYRDAAAGKSAIAAFRDYAMQWY